jgi:hypothetical protein
VKIANTLKAILKYAGFDAHAMFSGQELVESLERCATSRQVQLRFSAFAAGSMFY